MAAIIIIKPYQNKIKEILHLQNNAIFPPSTNNNNNYNVKEQSVHGLPFPTKRFDTKHQADTVIDQKF